MRNPGTVQLEDVIVHMLNPQGRGLITSERTLPLNDDLRAYFVAHVKNSLENVTAKAAKFKEINDQLVSGVCAALLDGALDLVAGSQTLALRLYDIMSSDRRISPGGLVVCFYKATNYPKVRHLALLKIDPSEVFRHETKFDKQGKRYVGFEVETEAMPSVRERLQKCAFIQPLRPRPDYDMILLDRQAGMDRDVAKFFAEDFLGADPAFDARMRTNLIYQSLVSARNQLYPESISLQEQADLDEAIKSAIASKQINVDTWLEGLHVSPEVKTQIDRVVSKNLPDRKFELDRPTALRLISKRRFRGDNGLKVEIRADSYDQVMHSITYVKDDPGKPPYFEVVIHTEKWDEVTR
ncbi:MAG: hypothetical protein DRJ03_29950 [Chloroflexi bacterium]|nr:MAG: hypothetical protein DRJ03_29950 [Chloroflexota bacterium]